MKQPAYRDRDYAFGQAMLTFRSAMGLTQTGLAELLGISRYAIGHWEAGDKYPKVEHLKQFITLAVRHNVFPAGREAEEIRALWQLAHQKVLLDERWLAALLTPTNTLPISSHVTEERSLRTDDQSLTSIFRQISADQSLTLSVAQKPRVDWGGALTVPTFYGRDQELTLLTDWIVRERCRIVSIVGMGGIGKSALAVSQMYEVAEHFEVVIWRSLRDAPTCEMLLGDCLQVLDAQAFAQTPANLEQHIGLLLECLRSNRVLLVLDNLETLMDEGENVGHMRPGYEGYGRMLRHIADTNHQSCLLLTSREKVTDLVPLEGGRAPVRTLRLAKLNMDACAQLLLEKDVAGSESERRHLIETYAGNPLALKIVAQTIVDLFDGEIIPFLEQGEVIFGGVRDLLSEQFFRLSPFEQNIMLWLAVLREPSTIDDLMAVMVMPGPRARLLEAIEALSRRSLIERGQQRGSFTLQSVVLEYVTVRLIAEASDEIEQGRFALLAEHRILLAQAPEYVRQTQERLIVRPILAHLHLVYPHQPVLEERLLALLDELRIQNEEAQGYSPANVVTLLRLLRGNLRAIDLSHLVLRDLNLQGAEMQDASLVNATIQGGFFTEAFDVLTGIAVSSTGKYWAASSRQGEIRIWEAGGQLLRHAWRGHIGTIWALTISPNGRLLASGSNDGWLKLWSVASGSLLWSSRHASDVNRLSFSPDGVTLASANDSSVCVWDVASGTLLQTLTHPYPVAAVRWSPDGHLLASGDVEGDVRLWAMNQPAILLQTLTSHASCADGLAFAPDSRFLASASWDGTVKLWEVSSGRLLQTLTGHTDRVGRVAWSPDGTTIASGSADHIILLWDVEQAIYRGALKGHISHIYEIAFTPDSRSLLSSSRDGSLRVWDVVSEQCVQVIRGYATSIYDVDWSPDSGNLVSGGTDLVVNIWDVQTEAHLRVLQEHTGVVCAVGWSPNGHWLASSDGEYGIRLWDLTSSENFRFLRQPDNSGNYLYGIAWSPDGQRLASGTHLHGVMIWDVITGEEVWIGRHSSAWFPKVAWSPDGTRLAAGGDDGGIYIWNITEDSLEQQFLGHHSRIMSLDWSPDGARLASGARGAEEGELFVWNLQNGQRLHSLGSHRSVVTAVVWDTTGSRLISDGGHGALRWWDAQSGECLWVREAHNGAIQSLRRSPDGTKLASCGDDGAIMIWDISTGEHLQTLRRDRPYERLNITGIKGLTEAQKGTLYALGAIENV